MAPQHRAAAAPGPGNNRELFSAPVVFPFKTAATSPSRRRFRAAGAAPRTALHGYETSVRFLKEQPWPEDLLGKTAIELFYAHSLVTYARAYSREIRQRDRLESQGPVDLKTWSMDRISAEATSTALSGWERRERLGALPNTVLAEYVAPNTYPRAAGFEPESTISRYRWNPGIGWYEEIRDSGTNFFFDALPQGEYTFTYRIRAATAGTFKVAPATLQPLYAPEFTAYSAGSTIGIGEP